MTLASGPAAVPFFLPVDGGQRFCLFHPAVGDCRGAVLYVHPFAEELNRSRRMAALQARALAAQGYGVLQIDLHGCGDSSGDFGDARWETWRRDLASAHAWLDTRLAQPITLLGLRLGAALALDFARTAAKAPARIVLWQPALSGPSVLAQFLRLRVANDMLSGGDTRLGTAALRAALARGETLEIAGYDLHPELAQAIDALDAALLTPHKIPVHWFELATAPDRPLTAAASSTVERWRRARVLVQARQVVGQPFWSTQEITECPALVAATCEAIQEPVDAV
ncbi:hydrolase 2, exosortase A system-associated [Massilia sp. H6]|uniref:hydrolase 2, exosortase A system-associated n=1 Tax=Massilia sp. H6 TaxID=2970464 RepID=UPI0021675FBB|nr:hydrolase 2, exosortase A system-associated [Massilia sp. H6]UVW28883.1 hydrolase 2, exosortase A system-associated [Massilia sp. H6]